MLLPTLLASAVVLGPVPAAAAQEPVPVVVRLGEGPGALDVRLGMLLQVVVDPAVDGADPDPASVDLAAARLRLEGELDGGFTYLLQTNFAARASVLDARVGWRASPRFGVVAGRFKTPFSRELLTYAGSIDFVNRARVVEGLAPARQLGVEVAGDAAPWLRWRLGGFTGAERADEGEPRIGVARLEVTPDLGAAGSLAIAVNAAAGRDGAVGTRALPAPFLGDGRLLGADARFERGPLLLAAEGITADWDPDDAGDLDAGGLHLTAGWSTSTRTQVLARWDRYRPPDGATGDALVLGLNVWPTVVSEVQVNWIVPLGGSGWPHELLVNFQIGF